VLDFGRDAQLTAGSPITSLVVSVRGGAHYDDQLDLDGTLRVKIQAGSVGTDRVFVDSVEIGTAFRDTSSQSLHFDFNAKATPERVQEIVRSLSYEDFYDTPSSGTLTVDITITDGGGRQVKGTSTVYFDAGQIPGLLVEGTANGDILNGTRGADTIKGLAGNDTIFGMSGHDAIYGGEGNDRLTGGPGFDAFVFDTTPYKKTNVDRIMDFQAGGDEIWLDHAVFGRLGSKPGVLKKAHFVKGAKALDKNDFVIYDSKKGILFYDKDGVGGAKAVQIANLKKSLALGHKDFFVI
jgi:Ca2+-binding RTX toxin-like protein